MAIHNKNMLEYKILCKKCSECVMWIYVVSTSLHCPLIMERSSSAERKLQANLPQQFWKLKQIQLRFLPQEQTLVALLQKGSTIKYQNSVVKMCFRLLVSYCSRTTSPGGPRHKRTLLRCRTSRTSDCTGSDTELSRILN